MAGETGTAAHLVALEQALRAQPFQFDFFQLLRMLECAHKDKPRFGQSLRPIDDPVRLSQTPALQFAPSSLARYEPGDDERPPRLGVHFFGLLGSNGPLPLHLTEYIYDRQHNWDDPSFARFLDIFHHRMLSLFYRAWAATQPAVQHDRPDDDRYAMYVGALFGLGMPALRGRDSVPDRAKLYQAGRLSGLTRNAEGLQALLQGFFHLPFAVMSFIAEWMPLPPDCQCRLGASPQTGTLGTSVLIGSHVWQCQHKFRLIVGPIGFQDYRRLLPGSSTLQRLVDLVRQYVGDEHTWDLQLILKKEELPAFRLGASGGLGWTSWLAGAALHGNADDLVLNPLSEQ